MRLIHMSRRTEASYLHDIVDFICFQGKHHSRDLGYVRSVHTCTYLATGKGVAPSPSTFVNNPG
jgi:hypothetical protein